MTDQNNLPNQPDKEPESKPQRKRRRGWWWKIPLILLAVLLIVVLLLPTLASTSPVRNMILGQINANLPGKLLVADWSLGWFSGIQAQGIEWQDADGRRVATISEVNTPITLAQLVRGNMRLGEIVLRGVQADVVVPLQTEVESPREERGRPREPSPSPAERRSEAERIEIPDISARLRVEDVGGQITFKGEADRAATLTIDKSTRILADIPGGGAPATLDVLIALAQPTGTSETKISATVNGVCPGPLDLKAITANGELELTRMDLRELAEIARAMGQELALEGVLAGKVQVSSSEPGQVAAKGEFAASNVVAKLQDDQFRTQVLRIPIDAEVSAGDAPALVVRQLGLTIDQGQIAIAADVPLVAVEDLQNNRPISRPGKAMLVAELHDLPGLMNALGGSIGLQEGVEVTGGQFQAQVNVELNESGIAVHVPVDLRGLAATTSDGKQIGPLQPLELEASARIPTLDASLAEICDVLVNVRSSFMSLNAAGSTLARTTAEGQADLARLRDEFGAFVDLSALRGGKVTLNLANNAGSAEYLDSRFRLQVSQFGYDLPPNDATPARRIEDGSVLVTGQSHYEQGKLTLPEPLKVEAGAKLLELADGGRWTTILDESLQLLLNGSASFSEQPTVLSISQLEVNAGKSAQLVKVSSRQGETLNVLLDGKRGVATQANLQVNADLAAIHALANRISKPASDAVIQRGTFDGVLTLTVAENGDMQIKLAHGKSEIVYGSPGDAAPYVDQFVVNLALGMAGDDSRVDITADVTSRLLKLALEAAAGLNPQEQGIARVKELRIVRLDAQNDYAQVRLASPLVISDVPALVNMAGGSQIPEGTDIGGDLILEADLGKLMAAGTTQPSATKISGQLTSRQTISLRGRDVRADLSAQIADLIVVQDGNTVVEDPRIELSGIVRLMPDQNAIQLNRFALTSSTGMLSATAQVRIDDLLKSNQISRGEIEIKPDWPKLWPVIYAMFPPERQQKVGEMEISGSGPIAINLGGCYPLEEPYESAVRKVVAWGSVPLEQVNWKTYGIIASGVIPFRLESGSVYFIEGTLAQARRAQPLIVNSGTVDLSTARIDITGEIPRLNIPDNTPLASKVQLNNVLVASLGKFANPLFIDPQNASGEVGLAVIYCRDLPLTTAIYEPDAGGEAQVRIDLRNLNLASKGADYFLKVLSIEPGEGEDKVVGQIDNGIVTIAGGQVAHQMSLRLGDRAFSFDGLLRMEDMTYSALNAGVPRSVVSVMLDKWFGVEKAEQYLPEQVSLRFTGPANALKLDTGAVDKLVSELVKQRAASAIGGLLDRGKNDEGQPSGKVPDADRIIDLLGGKGDKASTQPSQPRQEKPLGGLLDMLGGRRDEGK